MVAMETVTNQYLGGDTSLACSAETQSKIDAQVVELVRKQHEKALTILKDNRGKLDELASYLYEHESVIIEIHHFTGGCEDIGFRCIFELIAHLLYVFFANSSIAKRFPIVSQIRYRFHDGHSYHHP